MDNEGYCKDIVGRRRTSWDACVSVLSCVRLVLINFKIVDIWDDEASRRDIVGCVRLSFKLRAFNFS